MAKEKIQKNEETPENQDDKKPENQESENNNQDEKKPDTPEIIPPPPPLKKTEGIKTPAFVAWVKEYNPSAEMIEKHVKEQIALWI